jgi:hypothetical protein
LECGQTLLHRWLGHRLIVDCYTVTISNSIAHGLRAGHLASAIYSNEDGNNAPYFLLPTLLVGGIVLLVLPPSVFVVLALSARRRFTRMWCSTGSTRWKIRACNPATRRPVSMETATSIRT